MEAHNTQHTKSTDPGVSQAVGLNGLDYSKINVEDMCYFLNDRTDLTSNDYLKGVSLYNFQNVEMYNFIKFKTDNFDKYKFSLFIDDIRSFIPIFDQDFEGKIYEDKRAGFEISDGDLYSPETKLHDFIRKVQELRPGFFLHGSQFHLTRFSELAEKIYDELQGESKAPAIEELQKVDDQATTLKAVTKDKHIVRMKMIYTYLKDKRYIDCPENDFLYWFGLFEAERPHKKIKWLNADSKLKNIIHHICGKSGEKYIRIAFIFNNRYISTNYKKDYEGSELFHKIESYLFHAVTKI